MVISLDLDGRVLQSPMRAIRNGNIISLINQIGEKELIDLID